MAICCSPIIIEGRKVVACLAPLITKTHFTFDAKCVARDRRAVVSSSSL